jgi:hypothetical protein
MKEHLPLRCLVGFAPFLAMILPVLFSAGCQETPLAGETYRKTGNAWPLFAFENTEGINDNKTTWRKEKGEICLIGTWEKAERRDKDGFLIHRKNKSGIFPLYMDELEESKEFRDHKGSIIVFPFHSRRTKIDQTE